MKNVVIDKAVFSLSIVSEIVPVVSLIIPVMMMHSILQPAEARAFAANPSISAVAFFLFAKGAGEVLFTKDLQRWVETKAGPGLLLLSFPFYLRSTLVHSFSLGVVSVIGYALVILLFSGFLFKLED